MMRTVGAAGTLALARHVDELARVTARASTLRHTCAQTFVEDGVERATPDGPPTAFRIWKAGEIVTDHGTHYFTRESASSLIADQRQRNNRYSIDVDHMSMNMSAPPANHKAVGWFSIGIRNGECWAENVEWTDEVRAGLTKSPPEWRYFSPAYDTVKKTGEIARLLNLALTNNPATHEVTALASINATKETVMEEYEKMTLAALVAAMDDEKDEEKRAAMEKCVRAKFKAAFPDPDEKKKDEGEKKETKSTKANEDGDDKKEEPKKETVAASINVDEIASKAADKAIVSIEAERKKREEASEKERILAALPAGDRETYKDLSLEQVKRIVTRHHSNALQRFTAAANATPTRGANLEAQRASQLPADERRKLDEEMGLVKDFPIVEERDGVVTFRPGEPQQAARFLASMARAKEAIEKETGALSTEVQALDRVFSTQKGAAR